MDVGMPVEQNVTEDLMSSGRFIWSTVMFSGRCVGGCSIMTMDYVAVASRTWNAEEQRGTVCGTDFAN
jgi:hypothetical protein